MPPAKLKKNPKGAKPTGKPGAQGAAAASMSGRRGSADADAHGVANFEALQEALLGADANSAGLPPGTSREEVCSTKSS